MQKYLVFAYLVGSMAACRSDATNPDGGVSHDLSVPPGSDLSASGGDMSRVYTYTDATIHDIDVNTNPTSPLAANKPVGITDVVAISDVRYFLSHSKTICTYEVYVQDPACTTPPCGMDFQIEGPMAMSNKCPSASASGTLLATVKIGDKVTAKGFTDTFTQAIAVDGGATGTLTQHSLDLKDLQVTSSGNALPAGLPIADPTIFSSVAGSGWAMYESTRVTFSNVTIATAVDAYGNFTTTPGNLSWGGDYDSDYRFALGGDAGNYPTLAQHFSSLTGFVSTFPLAYGKLFAVQPSDLVP